MIHCVHIKDIIDDVRNLACVSDLEGVACDTRILIYLIRNKTFNEISAYMLAIPMQCLFEAVKIKGQHYLIKILKGMIIYYE